MFIMQKAIESLVGLCQVVPFGLFEFQSKWIAGVLSNRITLPSVEEMMEDVKTFYSKLEISGMPKRYTHYLGDSQVLLNFSTYHDTIAKCKTSFFFILVSVFCSSTTSIGLLFSLGVKSMKNGGKKYFMQLTRTELFDQRHTAIFGTMTI